MKMQGVRKMYMVGGSWETYARGYGSFLEEGIFELSSEGEREIN